MPRPAETAEPVSIAAAHPSGRDRSRSAWRPLAATAAAPSLLRLVPHVVKAGADAGRPVSLCGEMAGDPLYTILLLGMGLREFSVSARSIPAGTSRATNPRARRTAAAHLRQRPS